MELNLEILQHKFIHKPLLIGGKAMEYYNLRKAGRDIDLVIHNDDHKILRSKYPDNVKGLELVVDLVLKKAYGKA